MVARPDVAGAHDVGGDEPTLHPRHPGRSDEPRPQETWRRFTISAAVVVVIALAASALVWRAHSGTGTTALLRGALALFPALIAVSAWATAQAAAVRSRAMWRLMALAGGLWTLAEATRSHGHAITGADPGTSLTSADVIGLLAVVPATAMLLGLVPRQAGAERRRLLLGALVIGGSVFFLFASLAPRVMSWPAGGHPIVSATWAAFPIAYIVLASLALFVLAGRLYEAEASLWLVAAGFLLFAVASATGDTATAPETAAGVIAPHVAGLLGYLALILAPQVPGAARLFDNRPDEDFERPGSPSSLLVFVPLLSLVVIVSGLTTTAADVLLRVTEICTLLLFGLRQALIARESARLHDEVETRVRELQRTSASLARLAQQNERTIEAVSDGIFGVAPDGRITFANGAALAMLGCHEREIVGRHPDECFLARRVDGHSRPTADPVAIALGSARPSGPRTAIFTRRDGREFPVEWSAGPVECDEDASLGAVVVFRDITRRREVERLKDDFVSVVNHELRTPLTSIRGVLGLLDGGVLGTLTKKGTSLVRGGVESTERLTRLVNDLLDFDRIESGAATLQLADRDVEHLVRTALDGVRPLAADVHVRLATGETDGRVRADGDRVVQTLTNLLGNAIKFSPPHTTITTSAVRRADVVEFTVSDQGRGIPSDKLEQIFERFEQVDSSDSRLQGGTGLGLAISRTIVRRHGGEIWAECRPGEGSTFRFTIPAASSQRAETKRTAASPAGLASRLREPHRHDAETAAAGANEVRGHVDASV